MKRRGREFSSPLCALLGEKEEPREGGEISSSPLRSRKGKEEDRGGRRESRGEKERERGEDPLLPLSITREKEVRERENASLLSFLFFFYFLFIIYLNK